MGDYFNQAIFREEVNRLLSADQGLIDIAFQDAQEQFAADKADLLKDFDQNEVTVELKEDSKGATTDGSLIGEGNLFSFIGFPAGIDPTTPIRELLADNTEIKKRSLGAKYDKEKVTYQFPVFAPTMSEIENATPMPEWDSGSWVRRIEKSITGITNYLFKADGFGPKSRSQTGLQSKKGEVQPGRVFTPIIYMSAILDKFLAKYK